MSAEPALDFDLSRRIRVRLAEREANRQVKVNLPILHQHCIQLGVEARLAGKELGANPFLSKRTTRGENRHGWNVARTGWSLGWTVTDEELPG